LAATDDDDHVRLSMIIDDQPVTGYVKPDDPSRRSEPGWQLHSDEWHVSGALRSDADGAHH